MIFTPFAFMAATGPTPPTTLGLVAKYDEPGTYFTDTGNFGTWADSSGNGYTLTFNGAGVGSVNLDTLLGYDSLLVGGAVTAGTTSTISDWTSTNDVTHIEILRSNQSGNSTQSTFAIRGVDGVGSFFPVDWADRITTFRFGGGLWALSNQDYDTAKTQFVARRFESGYNNSGDSLVISYGDSFNTGLTHIGSGTGLTNNINPYPPYSGTTVYTIGTSAKIIVANRVPNPTGGNFPGRYMVNLFYNRILTDAEIENIYSYYQPTYNLV